MDDKDLRDLIARETTTPLGKAHFENILDGLDKIAVAWANPQARPEAEKLLKAWMADDQPELRKAMSGAWLQRARAVAGAAGRNMKAGAKEGASIGMQVGEQVNFFTNLPKRLAHRAVGAGAGAVAGAAYGAAKPGLAAAGRLYMRGADKAQAFGSRVGAKIAASRPNVHRDAAAAGQRAVDAVSNRVPRPEMKVGHSGGRDFVYRQDTASSASALQGARRAGAARVYEQARSEGSARGGRIARGIYHGAAATGAAGAGYAAGQALSEKQREQRRNAAKARWGNRGSAEG